jgi:hypothetical protein
MAEFEAVTARSAVDMPLLQITTDTHAMAEFNRYRKQPNCMSIKSQRSHPRSNGDAATPANVFLEPFSEHVVDTCQRSSMHRSGMRIAVQKPTRPPAVQPIVLKGSNRNKAATRASLGGRAQLDSETESLDLLSQAGCITAGRLDREIRRHAMAKKIKNRIPALHHWVAR